MIRADIQIRDLARSCFESEDARQLPWINLEVIVARYDVEIQFPVGRSGEGALVNFQLFKEASVIVMNPRFDCHLKKIHYITKMHLFHTGAVKLPQDGNNPRLLSGTRWPVE